jgi:hypothetical protein
MLRDEGSGVVQWLPPLGLDGGLPPSMEVDLPGGCRGALPLRGGMG